MFSIRLFTNVSKIGKPCAKIKPVTGTQESIYKMHQGVFFLVKNETFFHRGYSMEMFLVNFADYNDLFQL